MERKHVKVWYDAEGDYLGSDVRAQGRVRETANDQVMEKVDAEGVNVIGFSVLKVSALKEHPIDVALGS